MVFHTPFHSKKRFPLKGHSKVILLRRRGFHLRKWLSNNEQVITAIPDSERARLVNNYSFDESSHERVLGVNWDIKEDQFTFFINLPHNPFTKRGVLSTIASLYDPLGFVSPVVLEAKVFLQGLTRRKAGWDEEITSSESERRSNWLSLLSRLNEVSVPRCFKTQELANLKNAEIHNFSDASSFAYGACSYLRLIDENGNLACSFLIGKSRVSPIKAISIPRLELTAAVLAVRLTEKMQRELNLESCISIFWCDSTAVFNCIKNRTKRFPVFVANRLAIIEQGSDPNNWHYLPSKLNPADLPSRGVSASCIDQLNAWLRGPGFLQEPILDFSKFELPDKKLPEEFCFTDRQSMYASLMVDTADVINCLINRSSSLHKLKRLTSWLLRFKNFLVSKVRHSRFRFDSALTVDELNAAERALIRYVQRQHFPFLTDLKNKNKAKTLPRYMQKLQPIEIDGIVRVGGRLEKTVVEFDVKHPIILPQKCHFSQLVIRQYHVEMGHSGTSHTWASVREKFWIVKGGSFHGML